MEAARDPEKGEQVDEDRAERLGEGDAAELEAGLDFAPLLRRRRRLEEKLASQEREYEELKRQVNARLAAAREEEKGAIWSDPLAAADEEVEIELLRRRTAAEGEAR